MDDNRTALLFIADLIEAPNPRDTLSALAKDLSDITRMAAKARALSRSNTLSQSEAHGIFSRLAERGSFKEYAFATVISVLNQPDLPAALAVKARRLKARTEKVDADLQATLLQCYLRIAKRLSHVPPVSARKAINLAELSKQLQQASEDLSQLLHNVRIVAKLSPLPVTMANIEKARADLRHNRAEIAIAAAQLKQPGHASGNLETDAMFIAAQEAILSIAHTLDTLELAYKDMEDRLNQTRDQPATVH